MTYFLLAGERSGDLHAAHLTRALRRHDPGAVVRGWGGAQLEEAGAEVTRRYETFSVMGFLEVAGALVKFGRLLKEVEAELAATRPDAVVLIDFGGFNLRVARVARRLGLPVFYYISPKLWAWGQGRVKAVRERVDQMFLILPFETEFYARHNFPNTDYIGNPLLDAVSAHRRAANFHARHHLPPDKPIIAVLPGSRRQEVEEMLHVMVSVVPAVPDHTFVVAGVSNLERSYYRLFEGRYPNLRFVFDETYDLLAHSRVALVTSGTATLETALFNVPQVVCYSTSFISYWISRLVIKVPFISLVNLIAGRRVVPELIQREFTGGYILEELRPLLADESPARQAQLAGYADVRQKLGEPGAPDRAAKLMVGYLGARIEKPGARSQKPEVS